MTNLTQLYDKEGNPLYPKINLKTINGEALFAEQEGEDITISVNSSSSIVKIIFIYNASIDKPATPTGGAKLTADGIFNYYGIDDGWCNEEEARNKISENNELLLWSSYITLQYGQSVAGNGNFWSTPSLVTTGSVGVDGSDIKFIYCLTTDSSAPSKCTSTGDNFVNSSVKGEWSDEPMGIDDTYKYEWVSMSVKESGHNKSFGEFTKPAIWSKWGEDGMDGAGVEYIYCLNNDNEAPSLEFNINDAEYQKPEYKPDGWSDNYTAPSYNNRYSWVAIRHYKDGKWTAFSGPELWNVYKVAGKAFADLYRRSDTSLNGDDLPRHTNSIYYLFENDKYYSTPDKQNEILQVDDWFGDVPTEGGRYLYKTQAYVDIVDIDEVVEIKEDKWSGPYFISLNGENSNNVNSYITMDNDSFSLPVNETYKTFTGIEYKDSLNAKLMYGDNELDIEEDNYDVEYDVNVFDVFDISLSGKTLKINFKIKNNIEIKNVEYISITLRGNYNDKEYEAKKSFKIIPYVSTIGEFYKIRVNDDTVYVDKSNNGGTWKHTIITELVDSKGNKINPNDIGCYFTYSTKIEGDVSTFTSTDNTTYNLKVDASTIDNLTNPLCIKLKDNSIDTEREVEYIDFVNIPQNGSQGDPGITMYTEYAFTSISPNIDLSNYLVYGGNYNLPTHNLETKHKDNGNPIDISIKWHDTLPSYIPGNSIWMIKKIYSSNDNSSGGVWDKPVRIMDSEHLQVEYCASTNNPANGITQMSVLATNNPTLTLEELEQLFRDTEASTRGIIWGDESISDPTWMAVSKLAEGGWSDWTVTRIKGEKGDPGESGVTPYHIEIENEFDIISTTDGITNSGQCITTNIKLLEGNLPHKLKSVEIDTPNSSVFFDNSTNNTIKYNNEKDGEYESATIGINIRNNVKADSDRYTIAVKVTYDNKYDNSSELKTITSFITLRVMNTSEVYQLDVNPGYVVDNEDTSIFAKIYKKGVDGITFINNEIAEKLGLQIKYLTNNEENSIASIDMTEKYNSREEKWSVYDYKHKENNKEIDIRLYKGETLYDNVNVEVKQNIQPNMQVEISPLESIVYLDSDSKTIAKDLKLTVKLVYDGKIVNVTSSNTKINIAESENYNEVIKNINLIGNQITIGINGGKEVSNGTFYFPLNVEYENTKTVAYINITFINSNLIVSGGDMFRLFENGDSSSNIEYSGKTNTFLFFNGKSISGSNGYEYSIDYESIEDSSLKKYFSNENNWRIIPDNYSIIDVILYKDENNNIADIIESKNGIIEVPFSCTYNNVTKKKKIYLYTNKTYKDIGICEIDLRGNISQFIRENETEDAIVFYPKYDSYDYIDLKILLENYNIYLTIIIDGKEFMKFDSIDKIEKIPKYNTIYAFYPNGYEDAINNYTQPIIKSEIVFKFFNNTDNNNRLISIESIERIVPIVG